MVTFLSEVHADVSLLFVARRILRENYSLARKLADTVSKVKCGFAYWPG
jgi:hypothetical protein